MKHLSIFVVAMFLLSLAVTPVLAAEHTKDSLKEVQENLKKEKAILLDVREPREWKAGHLQQAVLLPLSELKKQPEKLDKAFEKKMPKERAVYIHCGSGARCLLAAEILAKQGYEVRPLKAGFDDLVEAGFPVAEPEKAAK